MTDLLSVETVFFTALGYPMSYIEFIGTALYLWSVWLIGRRNVLTWPVGIASVLLYMALFYQIRLYSDTLEQVYYLVLSIYGWWHWSRSQQDERGVVAVSFSSGPAILLWMLVTGAISAALGMVMSSAHRWAPSVFVEPASYAYLDALTTVMSLSAMWLMVRKRIESWIYWIVVDIIGIGLYYAKDVKLIALLYVLLLGLAIKGLVTWTRERKRPASGGGEFDEFAHRVHSGWQPAQ